MDIFFQCQCFRADVLVLMFRWATSEIRIVFPLKMAYNDFKHLDSRNLEFGKAVKNERKKVQQDFHHCH